MAGGSCAALQGVQCTVHIGCTTVRIALHAPLLDHRSVGAGFLSKHLSDRIHLIVRVVRCRLRGHRSQ